MSYCDCKITEFLKALVTCLEFYGDDLEEKGRLGWTWAIDRMIIGNTIYCAEKIREEQIKVVPFTIVDSDK